MKSLIVKVSKFSVLNACLLAGILAAMSNSLFTYALELFVNDSAANTTNNVIDCLQLAVFMIAKLATSGRFNRYDLPFIIGGMVSIFA